MLPGGQLMRFSLAAQAAPTLGQAWMWVAILLLMLALAGVVVLSVILRRMLSGSGSRQEAAPASANSPSTDNPAAFMTASMQAVIQKLREQEKELAALHKLDRERAQQTERLSEAVTRNMPAGLLIVSSAGLITSANPAAEVALGVRSLAFRRHTEVFGADSPLSKLLAGCLSQGRTFRREEVEYTTPAGELRKLGVTVSPIQNPASSQTISPNAAAAGQVTGALCLLTDLTELAALQRQVRMKESLAALGELSAGIAHEFKNSLATISGYAQLILAESEGDISENAQRIVEQTRSLAHVVTEFLKFARPMELVNEEVAVGPLIERVVAEIHDALPAVELSVSGEFESVSGDDGLLKQVLLNVIRNAAEATGEVPFGGRVMVRGSLEHVGGRAVQRISVSDNGPGIPAEHLSKIFAPFYTTKATGTGLGLAIVQKIVVQHGGAVEARNQPEGGAEVIVWLPLATPRAAAIDSMAASVLN